MIRNRILALRHVLASTLLSNPKNWRLHPAAQRDALAGILAEVGYVDALLARPLPDGSLQLIDGHLRADLTPDEEVPVLLVDLNDSEADKVLATFDPLSALAEADNAKLQALLDQIETSNPAVESLLEQLAASTVEPPADDRTQDLQPIWQVVVECDDEATQREVFEELRRAGRKCRLLNLY